MCVLFEQCVSYDMSVPWLTEARKDNKWQPEPSYVHCDMPATSWPLPCSSRLLFSAADWATDYPDHVYMLLPA
jgi:hypothetical protein